MASELLLDDAQAPEQALAREQLAMLRRAAESMNQLIQDLLDAKRIESDGMTMDKRAVSVIELVTHAVQMLQPLASAASLALESVVAADLPAVYADPARIQQLLSNLVGNAIKFTPQGGRITISARPEGPEEVRISVRDTGPGISPDQLPHVFERHWQGQGNDRRGVGLGLSIVKGIVEAHDGRVWVESHVGQGSEFIFTLPVADKDVVWVP